MDEKQLRKLKRIDLLELLLEETKRNEELEAKLAERTLKLDKVGSIAEASLALNEVFEKAQAAADMYVENVKKIYEEAQEMVNRAKANKAFSNTVEEENNGEE